MRVINKINQLIRILITNIKTNKPFLISKITKIIIAKTYNNQPNSSFNKILMSKGNYIVSIKIILINNNRINNIVAKMNFKKIVNLGLIANI
jgi:hypothetical protein